MKTAGTPRTPLQLRELALESAKKRLAQVDTRLSQERGLDYSDILGRKTHILAEIKSLEKQIADLSKGGK